MNWKVKPEFLIKLDNFIMKRENIIKVFLIKKTIYNCLRKAWMKNLRKLTMTKLAKKKTQPNKN